MCSSNGGYRNKSGIICSTARDHYIQTREVRKFEGSGETITLKFMANFAKELELLVRTLA